ncbi:RimJ/RimL family protein N-acetyltransferase [Paenibacillus cellulosilyticus]|uniref:RimJ/RimL family protein N-acetyltransferase n=1 Tax=Paenibacillus cellulosilyticus TaxID=375489 RepID=A0A2V2YTH3_9BACL|nr:GNAT family protein [Paenibacillus cellulosilyticus]PWW02788.1 RimJ/RimL family protein N-acetyltransferase [Paenibacillus cellulosilyticus]QKS45711.1 GNAT family N-acetyltransferase [Paenibacillus cellulosilyticus]
MNNNIWSGNNVRLRAILPTDWDKFHNNDFDSESARLCDVIHFPRSEEGTKHWAGNQASKGPDGDNFSLAIETLDGELVGSIVAHSCDSRHGTFKYGVGIFREHWRNGFASEAVRILLRYYFEELRYQKVTAHVYAFNEGSIALQERLGFVQEGRLRNMIYTKGQHFDEFVYGLTKSEYEMLNN